MNIALCFLTYDNLAQPKIWQHFDNSQYNIYIHNKNNFTGYFEKYCIKNKITSFDPGVQGEHKIRRGFEPEKTSSYHYIKENDFYKAIKEFCTKKQ